MKSSLLVTVSKEVAHSGKKMSKLIVLLFFTGLACNCQVITFLKGIDNAIKCSNRKERVN